MKKRTDGMEMHANATNDPPSEDEPDAVERYTAPDEIFSVKNPPSKKRWRMEKMNKVGSMREDEANNASKKVQGNASVEHYQPAQTPLLPSAKKQATHADMQPQPIVTDAKCIDPDEEYGCHEKALDEFTRLHPMLSLDSASARTLQLVASLIPDTSIPVKEIPIVPKSHDDMMLR